MIPISGLSVVLFLSFDVFTKFWLNIRHDVWEAVEALITSSIGFSLTSDRIGVISQSANFDCVLVFVRPTAFPVFPYPEAGVL